jgi:hypothetical protein
MLYADFASQLTRFPDHELVFEFGDATIGRGYHLTEVLRLTVDAIDCGGALDHWTETVLQLVDTPPVDGRPFMSANKAWGILQRSHARLPLAPNSELVLEFRPAGAIAAQRYHVSEVVSGVAESLRVVTHGARTQCKAAARSQSVCGATAPASAPSSCCGPSQTSELSRTAVRCCA